MATGALQKYLAHFMDPAGSAKRSTRSSQCILSFHNRHQRCSHSMNGCLQVPHHPRGPIGTIETHTLPAVASPSLAMDSLRSVISHLKSNPPPFGSGVIRLQVPIQQQIEAISWLHSQNHLLLPRCFFSRRTPTNESNILLDFTGENGHTSIEYNVISVAGVGSAVYFHQLHSFRYNDWKSIKRFLCKRSPLIRAYGAIRFDANAHMSTEWEPFGAFFFMVPQVEFDELDGSSLLATTIAWDDALSWSWGNAIAFVQATLRKVSSNIVKLNKEASKTFILGNDCTSRKMYWDSAVKRALQMIHRRDSALQKVVLACSTRIVPTTAIDPIKWLACLQVEGRNAYQFCIQPPYAATFIGNTPEQLFHRKRLGIRSEALAGTRARGASLALDLQIELDLLSSPKDHLEFTIVRDTIRKKLEEVCDMVVVKPSKAIRKLPRIQHLFAELTGRLRSEDDEFEILSSLHPSPAVCGFPTDEARDFIAQTEVFDRGMYAGPVGWFGGEESEFAVGIRSALVGKDHSALIYAGTGIVEGSNPYAEWDELELKISQFTKLLKLESPQTAKVDYL